jgi:hypothetical protein
MTLTYRDKGTSGTQIAVLSGNLLIASIGKRVLTPLAGQEVRWQWTFSIHAAPSGFEHSGHADTFEEAKAAVERNWEAWLKAAGLRDEAT